MAIKIQHPVCREKSRPGFSYDSETACNGSPNPSYSFRIAFQLSELLQDWEGVASPENNFTSSSYLNALEKNPPAGMSFVYIVFYKGENPIGAAYAQLQYFNAADSFQLQQPGDGFFSKAFFRLRKLFLRPLRFYVLFCGNLLVTGEHAFWFQKEAGLSRAEQEKKVREALEAAAKQLRKRKTAPSIILLKDFKQPNRLRRSSFPAFHEFTIQPAMFLSIREDWKQFSDYTDALSSKYRVRVRRARKKLKPIQTRELSMEYLQQHSELLNELYEEVVNESNFNLVRLDINYLLALKEKLGEQIKIVGYFQEEELVGFITLINNFGELDAHYIGFRRSLNHKHQLYLNMLLDIVREGIWQQVRQIHFARTALEIKSSIGAEAEELFCYARHRFCLHNRLMIPVFRLLKPEDDWVPRSPFKG
jgi:hypothetical protein